MPQSPSTSTQPLGILRETETDPHKYDAGAVHSTVEERLAARFLRLVYGKWDPDLAAFKFLEMGPLANPDLLVPTLIWTSGGSGFSAYVGDGANYPASAILAAFIGSSVGGAISRFGYSDSNVGSGTAGFVAGQTSNVVSALNGVVKTMAPAETATHDLGYTDDSNPRYWRNLYLATGGGVYVNGVLQSFGVLDADYLVGTAHGTLTNEIVVGTTPGGELGGTWASPTVDTTHAVTGGGWHPLAAYESSSQSVNNATLTNSDLIITPGLASTWAVRLYVRFDSLTDGGVRFDFSGATACHYQYRMVNQEDGVLIQTGEINAPGTDVTIPSASFGDPTAYLEIVGTFVTSTNIQFRFAQETDAGTEVSLQTRSHITGIRIV